MQGPRRSRKLNKGALSLYVGNGNRAAVEAIGSYELILPSTLIILLDNYHCVISLSRLKDTVFIQ